MGGAGPVSENSDSEPCLCLGDPLPVLLVLITLTEYCEKACVLAVHAPAEPSPLKGSNGFRHCEWELASTRWALQACPTTTMLGFEAPSLREPQ